MSSEFDVVVIGGGIGGLASAALLTAQGRRVLLVENDDRLGGFQHRFEREGFSFEPHFHFLQDAGPGRPVRALLEGLGIKPEFIRLDPIVLFRFPDRDLIVGNDRAAFIGDLKSEFPDESDGIDALFNASAEVYDALTRQRPSPLLAAYAMDTMDAFASRFVQDERLKASVAAWSAYFGYGSQSIAAFAIIVFTESCWDGGIYHPAGGIGSIVEALRQSIETAGGVVRTATGARRILLADGRVSGVELSDGKLIPAKIVVSNADAGTTFRKLLAQEPAAEGCREQLSRLRPFRSPFCVYLGVRSEGLDLRQGPAVRVAFTSYALDTQDEAQLRGDVEHAPVSLGVPTRTNKGLAPEGHDIVIVYTFITERHIETLLSDSAAADAFAQRLVQHADQLIPGLADQLLVMENSVSATPQLYTSHNRGSIGWAPTPEQLPILPPNRTAIGGLYLAGQWTQTGAGMNNVFSSAWLAASMIAELEAHG